MWFISENDPVMKDMEFTPGYSTHFTQRECSPTLHSEEHGSQALRPDYNGLINPPGAHTDFSQCRFTWALVFQLILSKAVGWVVG